MFCVNFIQKFILTIFNSSFVSIINTRVCDTAGKLYCVEKFMIHVESNRNNFFVCSDFYY